MKSLKNKIKTINIRKIVKIEILAFIIALLTLIVTRYTDILKKPVITFSNAPITLLKNNEPISYYDLYNEHLYSQFSYTDKFVTTINIGNPFSGNIQLNKLYINIKNIKRDTNPYFRIYSITKDDGVYLNIHNCGWGKADKLNFVFTCLRDISSDLNSINIYVEEIEPGQIIEYPFILNKNVKDIEFPLTIEYSTNCIMDGLNNDKAIKGAYLVYEIYDGKIEVPAMGGASEYVYGIEFDASNSSFSLERDILEEVSSGEIFTVPICIFPNQTCTFDLDIKFKYLYNGKEKYIHCQKKNMKVEIDSSFINECKKDISHTNNNDIENIFKNDYEQWVEGVIFSYPFIDNLNFSLRCPFCHNYLRSSFRYIEFLIPDRYKKLWKCDNCEIKF